MAVKLLLFLAAILIVSKDSFGQESEIEDIRLVNGTYGNHMGRVEIMYNGTWGTICDDFWSFSDAKVACQMLGYSTTVCSVTHAKFGEAEEHVPIWMDNLQCRGNELALDNCVFNGWGEHSCEHREDAGLICMDESLIDAPQDIVLLQSTTISLTIGWTFPQIPTKFNISDIRFRVRYQSEDSHFTATRFSYPPRSEMNSSVYNITLTRLSRDTEYVIEVQAEFRYSQLCFYNYLKGNKSKMFLIRTNSTLSESMIPVRLIPPEKGLDFIGRVEVFHDNTWGTICDDAFFFTEANVICGMLNFSQAVCSVSRADLGEGTGKIWLDNVNCRNGAEILDHCTFNRWGVHNCDHGDDVGIICMPDNYPNQVINFTIVHISSNSITVTWEPFAFPTSARLSRYQIQYRNEGSRFSSSVTVSSGENQYRIRFLRFGSTYNISIRVQIRFSSCFQYLSGESSEELIATTKESPPTGAPTAFHVIVVNCSAVRVQWKLPPIDDRNGIIRGYKLFLQPPHGNVIFINITTNETTEYTVTNLQAMTAYVISVLAYTVGDGPRSIHLTAITNALNRCSTNIIQTFGIDGNGLDRGVRFTYQRDVHIHCGSSMGGVDINWFYSNGTRVGIHNRNIHEGHFENGTSVLQIATSRSLSYCDAGVYTCIANMSGGLEERTFTFIINRNPPTPSRPIKLRATSTSITIGWDENECTGGHRKSTFNVRYTDNSIIPQFPFFLLFTYIRDLNASLQNFTIKNLKPDTIYDFSVSIVSVDSTESSYSRSKSISTLPAAPSAPRAISVMLVTPSVLSVTWRIPAVTNGQLVLFTVYAIPLSTEATQRQALSVLQPIKKSFPATSQIGNVTIVNHSITYQIQVSASIRVGSELNEGELSPITTKSTIFVPVPGLPIPQNVIITSITNSSIALGWSYPPPPAEPISGFKISYSGQIKGITPGGNLLSFSETGSLFTSAKFIEVMPLTPGTKYVFKVAAVTQKGQGKEIIIEGKTNLTDSTDERFIFFHIRIGPIHNCLTFQEGNITDKLLKVRLEILKQLNDSCSCRMSMANIQLEAFSCGILRHQILYRARLLGNNRYRASDLILLMQAWIGSDNAFITVDSSRLKIDPTCHTKIDTLSASDCSIELTPSIATSASASNIITSGEIGGIIVGVLIALFLLILIVLALGVIFWMWKPRVTISNNVYNKQTEEDKTPFTDIDGDSTT